jgi:hypothetical protein
MDDQRKLSEMTVSDDFYFPAQMTRRDNFAMAILGALISKQPLLDLEGYDGQKATDEQIQKRRHDTCASAWAYADTMLSLQ